MSSVPTVADIMQKKVISVTPETEILDVINVLLNNKISGVPVVQEEGSKKKVIGMISEKDCLKVIINDTFYGLEVEHHVAKNYMTANPTTIHDDEHLSYLANFLLQNVFRCMPVVDQNGSLVGIVSRADALEGIKYISENTEVPKGGYLTEEMKAKLM